MYSVYDNDQFIHVPTAFPIFCFVHALFFAPVKKKEAMLSLYSLTHYPKLKFEVIDSDPFIHLFMASISLGLLSASC